MGVLKTTHKDKGFQCQECECILEENTGGILCRKRQKYASACRAGQCRSTHVPAGWGSHVFRWGQGGTGESCPQHTCRVNGCWYYLLLCLAVEWNAFLCPLGAEGTHQKTASSPISFAGMDIEQFLGRGGDLAIWPCYTPELPRGPALILSWTEEVLPQSNPYMLVTLWPYNSMKVLQEKGIYQSHGLTMCP